MTNTVFNNLTDRHCTAECWWEEMQAEATSAAPASNVRQLGACRASSRRADGVNISLYFCLANGFICRHSWTCFFACIHLVSALINTKKRFFYVTVQQQPWWHWNIQCWKTFLNLLVYPCDKHVDILLKIQKQQWVQPLVP